MKGLKRKVGELSQKVSFYKTKIEIIIEIDMRYILTVWQGNLVVEFVPIPVL